jgi:hypothetical protein
VRVVAHRSLVNAKIAAGGWPVAVRHWGVGLPARRSAHGRRAVAQGRVAVVVLVFEVADHHSGPEQVVPVAAVKALFAKPVVERFDVAAVPRRARRYLGDGSSLLGSWSSTGGASFAASSVSPQSLCATRHHRTRESPSDMQLRYLGRVGDCRAPLAVMGMPVRQTGADAAERCRSGQLPCGQRAASPHRRHACLVPNPSLDFLGGLGEHHASWRGWWGT